MLDFRTIKKAQAPVNSIGNTCRHKRLFNHAALSIRAIQNRDFMLFNTAPHRFTNFLHAVLRFIAIIACAENTNTLAVARARPKVFPQTVIVMCNEFIGGIQNVTEGAVILFELNQVTDLKITLKIHHVADIGAAEGVNRLIVVTHREDAVTVILTNAAGGKTCQKF